MTLSTKTRTATIDALVGLAQLHDAMSGPREDAKKLTAVLSTTFIAMFHDAEITELQLKAQCESILGAVRVKMNNKELKEGELASAWRQYKSDTLKAIRMSAGEIDIRKTITTMSALKKYIGTSNSLGKLVEMVQAYTYHVKKGDAGKKAVHLKFADDALEGVAKAIADYAEKHAISLVKPPKNAKDEAPMVKAAKKPAKKKAKKKAAPMADIAAGIEALPAAMAS